jgi:hypothetical protein
VTQKCLALHHKRLMRWGEPIMLRIGGTASLAHMTVFKGLKTHFQR